MGESSKKNLVGKPIFLACLSAVIPPVKYVMSWQIQISLVNRVGFLKIEPKFSIQLDLYRVIQNGRRGYQKRTKSKNKVPNAVQISIFDG